MAAIVSIYGLGLLLCLAAGVALAGLLDPRGRWVGFATIPLGLCALIAVLYPLGALMPGYRVAPVAIGVVAVALAIPFGLRLRAAAPGRRRVALLQALRPTRSEAVVLISASIAGFLVLAPTIEQGFATTVAVTNNDGWGYAALIDWIKEHPLPRELQPDISAPLSLVPWDSMNKNFGIGFEHFAALLATVLDRQGFEVVNSASAVALAAAVGGWATLASSLRPRLDPLSAGLVALAAASPVAAIPFVENYTTQFVAICLWPFALGAFVLFAGGPSWRRLLVATIATGGVVGVYPAMTPWLVLPVAAVALLAPDDPAWARLPGLPLAGRGHARRLGRAVVLVAVLAVCVAATAPIQVVRAARNLSLLDALPINVLLGFFTPEAYASLVLGSAPVFSLLNDAPLGWSALAGLVLLAAAYALALLPTPGMDRGRWTLVAVAAGVLATCVAIAVRYRVAEELPYQVYKGLISGGAVLAGLAVIGLLPAAGARSRTIRLVGLGIVAAIWIPVTSQVLESSATPGTGFRAPDIEMGRALGELPAGSTVLVEGAAPDAGSFQYRMMAAYFGDSAPGVTPIGLGNTASYLTPGGLPEWRPAQPWSHVLTNRPQPVATDRVLIWVNGLYSLYAAPTVDLTTFGLGWYPPEVAGASVFAWTSDRAELVVSNRAPDDRRVRIAMQLTSYRRARVVSLTAPEATERLRLAADRPTTVTMDLDLPGDSATPVILDGRPGALPAPPGDERTLMLRVERLRAAELPVRPDR